MDSLDKRIALVTGASRGVGKGVALGLGEAKATVFETGEP
jgi:NAD(P)-dependent dehydrogenase (short-subunit alcohol dehydrogenase family)